MIIGAFAAINSLILLIKGWLWLFNKFVTNYIISQLLLLKYSIIYKDGI